MLLSDVCLSVAYTGLTREQRGLGQLKFAQRQPTSHVIWTPLSRSKGQLVADVLNSQHAGTGATWRINTKILSTCRGSEAALKILPNTSKMARAGQRVDTSFSSHYYSFAKSG